MDDTIEDLVQSWTTYLNIRYKTDVKPDDVTDWNIDKFYPSLTKQQVYEPILKTGFWNTVLPKKDAQCILKRLKDDGHTVIIVTSANYETLCAKMTKVLFKYFPFISWNDVVITSKKQLVRGDILIDDGIHNLIGGDYDKFLFDAPHNRTYDAESNGMKRVHDWNEIYDIIGKMAQ